jgi:putative transcriptional regulator
MTTLPTITHHPDDATLLAFASGTIGEALGAVVSAHRDLCRRCRQEVRLMSQVGGVLLEGIAPQGVMPARVPQLDSTKAALRETAARADQTGHSPTLARLLGKPLDSVAWKRFGAGVATCSLPLSKSAGGELYLLRVEPGRSLPEHGHAGTELTLVLSGSYRDQLGRFAAGDVADLDDDHDHKPLVDSAEPCICLIGSDGKPRFRGLVGRLLQPFFRV